MRHALWMMPKSLVALTRAFPVAIVAATLLFALLRAHSLSTFLPGHDPSLAKVHVVSFLVGVALLGYARVQRRKRWE